MSTWRELPMTAIGVVRAMREEREAREAFLARLLDPETPEAEVDQACEALGINREELRHKAKAFAARVAAMKQNGES